MRIANTVSDSIVDGPGLRFTVFTQGCPHRCPGCHNPDTHDPAGGRAAAVEELFAKTVGEAARDARRRLRQVEFRTQAPDHPILWGAGESYYLKFYIVQVVDER